MPGSATEAAVLAADAAFATSQVSKSKIGTKQLTLGGANQAEESINMSTMMLGYNMSGPCRNCPVGCCGKRGKGMNDVVSMLPSDSHITIRLFLDTAVAEACKAILVQNLMLSFSICAYCFLSVLRSTRC